MLGMRKNLAVLPNYKTALYYLPVPVEEVDIHLYCPVGESSLQQYGLCFLSLATEQSHGGISSFLGGNLLDMVDVLDFVSLSIRNVDTLAKS